MRKFTLFLASLFLSLGTLTAQDLYVTDLNNLSNDKVYFLESARCFLMNSANVNVLATSNGTSPSAEEKVKDWENENQQFKIEKDGDNYYLFSVGAGKYVTNNGSWSDTKTNALTFENVGGNYPWKLCIDGKGMNSQDPNQTQSGIMVNSWTNTDAGNCYRILDIEVAAGVANELTEFNPNKCYTATLKQRGGWAVNNEGRFVSYNQAGEVADANKQFAILSADNENYYLFNVGANAFVKKDGTTVQGIADPIVLRNASAEGDLRVLVQFKDYNDGYININGSYNMDICSWSAVDHGNAIIFIEADDFNPTEALAMLSSAATVTYTFTHEGKTIATQTATVNKGDAYPAINTTLPYGVTATKPEGTVEGTETKEIELSVNKELPFVTASDAASISNWYYVRMHTNQPGFIGDIANDNTINVANGKVGTSADSEENYLWGFVGNVFDGIKVVNKGTGLEMTTNGSGNVTLTEDGTSLYIVATSDPGKLNATDGFCLRNPNSDNYINANHTAGKLEHWNATDAGSTFMVIEPTESLDVEITSAGYATYYWDLPAYIPEGVQAFVVKELNGTYAIMNEVTGTIPANTGVILKGNAAARSFKVAHYVTAETTTAVSGNKLRGSVASTYIAPAENTTCYVLANGEDGIGLYLAALNCDNKGAEGTTHFMNNANKAYLVVDGVKAAASYSFNFDWAGTTGIEGVVAEGAENGAIYDITGRRVKAITAPGIYIVNGRKVVK